MSHSPVLSDVPASKYRLLPWFKGIVWLWGELCYFSLSHPCLFYVSVWRYSVLMLFWCFFPNSVELLQREWGYSMKHTVFDPNTFGTFNQLYISEEYKSLLPNLSEAAMDAVWNIFLFTLNDDWKVHLGNFSEWGKKIYTTVMFVSLRQSLSQKVVSLACVHLHADSMETYNQTWIQSPILSSKCFNASTQLALFCGLLWSVRESLHLVVVCH